MAAEEQFRIGVDTGGTFTDVIAVRQSDGTLFSSKVPSTPSDPSQALLSGVRRILGEAASDHPNLVVERCDDHEV